MIEAGYEFSTVVWLDAGMNTLPPKEIAAQQCGVCYALVQESAAQMHLNWHEEEGHLRP